MGWSDPLGIYSFSGWSGFPVSVHAKSWQLQACIVQLHLAWYERLMALGGVNDLPNIYTYYPSYGADLIPMADDVNYLFGSASEVPTYLYGDGLQTWLETNYLTVADYSTHLPPPPETLSWDPPTIKITGDGTGAAVVATISNDGIITSVDPSAAGSGYTSATASSSGGSGSGLVLGTVNISGGGVTSVDVTDGGSGWGYYDNRGAQTAWTGGYTGGEYDFTPDYTLREDTGGEDSVSKWIPGAIATLRGIQESIHALCGNFVVYPTYGDYDGYTGTTWYWADGDVHREIPMFTPWYLATNAGVPLRSEAGYGPGTDDYYGRAWYKTFKHLFGNNGSYTDAMGDPATYANSPSTYLTDGATFTVGDLAIHAGDNQADEDCEGFVGYMDGEDWVVVATRPGNGRVYIYEGGDVRWGTIPWPDGEMAHTLSADLTAVTSGANSTLSSGTYDFASTDAGKPIQINGRVYYINSVASGIATINGDCTSDVLAAEGAGYLSGWALMPRGTRPDKKTGYGFARRGDIITADLVNQLYAVINLCRWTQGLLTWWDESGANDYGSLDMGGYPNFRGMDWDDCIAFYASSGAPLSTWTLEASAGGTDELPPGLVNQASRSQSPIYWDSGGGDWVYVEIDEVNVVQTVSGELAETNTPVGIAQPYDTRFDPHTIACAVDFLTFCGINPEDYDPGTYFGYPNTSDPGWTLTEEESDDGPVYVGSTRSKQIYEFVDGGQPISFRAWKRFDSAGPSTDAAKSGTVYLGGNPVAQPPMPSDQTPDKPPMDGNEYGTSQAYYGAWCVLLAASLVRWDVSGGMQFIA